MRDVKSPELPEKFEVLGEGLVKLYLRNQFLLDGKHLFIAPKAGFCEACFLRRHQSQFDSATIAKVSDSTLSLAKSLDSKLEASPEWRWFLMEGQRAGKPFELIPYEDCTLCGEDVQFECDKATVGYHNLMKLSANPKIDLLRKQVFSFGFARGLMSDNQISAMNPAFERLQVVLDRILDNSRHSRVVYRVIIQDGRHVDDTSTGFAEDRTLSELKAIMEYLERYAFLLHTCRFKTNEFDDKIIAKYLTLYEGEITVEEHNHLRSCACWGIDLHTNDVSAIPLPFLVSGDRLQFIKPSSSGFAAHIDFNKSMCNSILELVERDAFMRFWYDPQRAYNFEPDADVKSAVDSITEVLKVVLCNDYLVSKYYIVKSPTRLPVVMVAITSEEYSKPPALCFGYGSGCDIREALSGALKELRINSSNLVKAVSLFKGYLQRRFTTSIESAQDRMNLYSTSAPREKLRFLDNENPLAEGVVDNVKRGCLDAVVDRFSQAGLDIYGLDFTPSCFQDKNVFVTRAFSPQLYPLQFQHENRFNLPTGPMSARNELPHFFL